MPRARTTGMRLMLATAVAGVLATAAGAAQPIARIPTGAGPCGVASGFGSVWVAVYDTGELVRIDPRRNRVTKRIRLAKGICPIAVGKQSLWVASDRANLLYRVDPRRGRITKRVRVAEWPAHIAIGLGSVWVSGYEVGTVARLDARTGRLVRSYRTGGNPSGLTFAEGYLWLAFGRGTTVGRLDLATGALTQFPLGHTAPGFLENIGGNLWTTTGDGYALRIDPSTGGIVATFRIPGTPAQPAAAPDGTIWVAEKERNTVTRIDPKTNRILDVGGAGRGALAIAVAVGDMWVTSYAGRDVWRFEGTP